MDNVTHLFAAELERLAMIERRHARDRREVARRYAAERRARFQWRVYMNGVEHDGIVAPDYRTAKALARVRERSRAVDVIGPVPVMESVPCR